jgi:hypothetical protein
MSLSINRSSHYVRTNPLVIVVVTLDKGCDTILFKILPDEIPTLPASFRIFITSRPQPKIVEHLIDQLHIRSADLKLQDKSNMSEMKLYVEQELHGVERRLFEGQVMILSRISLLVCRVVSFGLKR